jgi:hypothetical protein
MGSSIVAAPDDDSKDLSGITFEGQPLQRFQSAERSREVCQMLHEDIAEKHRCIKPPVVVGAAVDPRRQRRKVYVRHSRAVHLTDQQIRKEYGVMARPHSSIIANILELLLVNSSDSYSCPRIAEELKLPLRTVQCTVSEAFSHLALRSGSCWIEKDPQGHKVYRVEAAGFPNGVGDMLKLIHEGRRNSKKKQGKSLIEALFPKSEAAAAVCEQHDTGKAQELTALLQRLLDSGVEIKISGTVKVVIV